MRLSGRLGKGSNGPEAVHRRADHGQAQRDRDRAGERSQTLEACRKLGISENTCYRWRKEYGGLRVDQARRLKELERENERLKKLLAETMLDNAILKEVSSGNF